MKEDNSDICLSNDVYCDNRLTYRQCHWRIGKSQNSLAKDTTVQFCCLMAPTTK